MMPAMTEEFTENSLGGNGDEKPPLPTFEDQRFLSQPSDKDVHFGEETVKDQIEDAGLFSADVLKGLLGTTPLAKRMSLWSTSEEDDRLFHNTNVPVSVFVCCLHRSLRLTHNRSD